MTPKGVGNIRGIHSLNTRPGPMTESLRLLAHYRLAAEKDNLMTKLAWNKRQKDQTERRLFEIAHAIRALEGRAQKEQVSQAQSHHTFVQY